MPLPSPYSGYDTNTEFMDYYKAIMDAMPSYEPPKLVNDDVTNEGDGRIKDAHVIVIGIDEYKWRYPNTGNHCVGGATSVSSAVSNYIKNEQGMCLKSTTELYGKSATRDSILDSLIKVREALKKSFGGVVILYFAGYTRKVHGVTTGYTEDCLVPYDSGTDFGCRDIAILDLVAWANTLQSSICYSIIDSPHQLSSISLLSSKDVFESLALQRRSDPARLQRTNQHWVIHSGSGGPAGTICKKDFIAPYLTTLLENTAGRSAPTAVVVAALQDFTRRERVSNVLNCPGHLAHNYFLTSKISPTEPGLQWIPAVTPAVVALKKLSSQLKREQPTHLSSALTTSNIWCVGQYHTVTATNCCLGDPEANHTTEYMGKANNNSFVYRPSSEGELSLDFGAAGKVTVTVVGQSEYLSKLKILDAADVEKCDCGELPCDYDVESSNRSAESAIDLIENDQPQQQQQQHQECQPTSCCTSVLVSDISEDRSPKVSLSEHPSLQLRFTTLFLNNCCVNVPTKSDEPMSVESIREYADKTPFFNHLLDEYDLSFGFRDSKGAISKNLSPGAVYSDIGKCMYTGLNSNILLKPAWKGMTLQKDLFLRNMSTNLTPIPLGGPVIQDSWKRGYLPDGYVRDGESNQQFNTEDALNIRLKAAPEECEKNSAVPVPGCDVFNFLYVPVRCVGQADVSDACRRLTSPIAFMEDFCTDSMIRESLAIITSAFSSSSRQVLLWVHISCHSVVSADSQVLYMYDTPKYIYMTSAARRSGGVTTAIFNSMVSRLPKSVRLHVVLDTSKGYPTGGVVLPSVVGSSLPASYLPYCTTYEPGERSLLTTVSACRVGMHSWMLPPSGYLTRNLYEKSFWDLSMCLLSEGILTWHQFFCAVSLACSRLAWSTELKQQHPSVVHTHPDTVDSYNNIYTFTEVITRSGILFITGGMVHGVSKGDCFTVRGLPFSAKVRVRTIFATFSTVELLLPKAVSLKHDVSISDLFSCYLISPKTDRYSTLKRMIHCQPQELLLHEGSEMHVNDEVVKLGDGWQKTPVSPNLRNVKIQYRCGEVDKITLCPSDALCIDYWASIVLFDRDGSTRVIAEGRASEDLSSDITLSDSSNPVLQDPFIRLFISTSPLYFMDTPPIREGNEDGCCISLPDSCFSSPESGKVASTGFSKDDSLCPAWCFYDVVLDGAAGHL
eukprot:TRINITY_DN3368_c8_g1_i1.p1 TRINITY_DN3368_c8_g1~~TRINITY_DN3368_c8_g1_i1.p1  ORF type:complete len:1182 (+),score=180.24 TRINITY_DN3368_c8_g1_i1:69-3614(+)